ncbi:MAG: beta-ketoacyl-[acyl-carrier-protein] synthase II, partial [Halobacteriovoraceae bacterium]|nr:beta-ketoacyl-[acyl-carrier-protein] synthase II [Halobacteriovoraceae bacterium]
MSENNTSKTNFKRVAITGMGITCGLGHNLNEVWNNIIEGKPGISSIEQLSPEQLEKLAVKFAGEVKNFKLSDELLPEKEQARYDRFIHFGLHCTHEALTHAGLSKDDWKGYDVERIGCILGVGMGGFPFIEAQHSTFIEKGPRRVSPFFIPSIIPNMASGLVTIQQGIKGINYTASSACASAAHAIGSAATEIMMGRQDVMITGGTESVISELTITGFSNMKALSRRNDDPAKASRPFDTGRDGFVMGEGAGILILEDCDKAKAR